LRRIAQLSQVRPDLLFVPLRGNVDTRLRKCEEGEIDAIVLAQAGMNRLGFSQRATHAIEPEVCLPAVGQGALAIELRAGDVALSAALRGLVHTETEIAVQAERGVMLAVEGSCQVPVAAYALRRGSELWLRGMLATPDGKRVLKLEQTSEWPNETRRAFELGVELGQRLRRELGA
jgi:hydroxymethylbilane synthase